MHMSMYYLSYGQKIQDVKMPLPVPSNANLYKQYFWYYLLSYTMFNLGINVAENVKKINIFATAR
jgi:hypothetical protein